MFYLRKQEVSLAQTVNQVGLAGGSVWYLLLCLFLARLCHLSQCPQIGGQTELENHQTRPQGSRQGDIWRWIS